MNTRNLHEGQNSGNHDLDPYTDCDDERLQYLEGEFLDYFEEWEKFVQERPRNVTKNDREKMLLSRQTLDGLEITVRSIVACVRYLPRLGAPFILTEMFNQDILEQLCNLCMDEKLEILLASNILNRRTELTSTCCHGIKPPNRSKKKNP